jgi:hypothetical protein
MTEGVAIAGGNDQGVADGDDEPILWVEGDSVGHGRLFQFLRAPRSGI